MCWPYKKIGTRHRNLKKLPAGTPLTNAAILKIQTYYGLAIRRHATKTVKDMKPFGLSMPTFIYFPLMSRRSTLMPKG